MFAAYLHLGHYKPDWGDVPTWAAAFLALAAGLIAWRAYVVAKRAYIATLGLLAVESERDEIAAEERRAHEVAQRRAQADQIAVWYSEHDDGVLAAGSTYGAYVLNGSSLPIFAIRADFRFIRPSGYEEYDIGVLPLLGRTIQVLPPGKQDFIPFPMDYAESQNARPSQEQLAGYPFAVGMTFRDPAGRWWQRQPNGDLDELSGPPGLNA